MKLDLLKDFGDLCHVVIRRLDGDGERFVMEWVYRNEHKFIVEVTDLVLDESTRSLNFNIVTDPVELIEEWLELQKEMGR